MKKLVVTLKIQLCLLQLDYGSSLITTTSEIASVNLNLGGKLDREGLTKHHNRDEAALTITYGY